MTICNVYSACRWDPEEYSGLSRLELPPSKVGTLTSSSNWIVEYTDIKTLNIKLISIQFKYLKGKSLKICEDCRYGEKYDLNQDDIL